MENVPMDAVGDIPIWEKGLELKSGPDVESEQPA